MKKSVIYHMAMLSVIEDAKLDANVKLEIVKQLISDQTLAKWSEEQDEKSESK